MLTIVNAKESDFHIIQQIAYQTWPETYGQILSEEQLNYMLKSFYSEEALSENVSKKGHHFLLAKENDNCLGFVSYEHNCNKTNQTKIHKIYILPNTQGKGVGKALLYEVEKRAKAKANNALFLNVNRFNKALSFYTKMGFEIIGQEDIKLEHGYLMEDYIMQKRFDSV